MPSFLSFANAGKALLPLFAFSIAALAAPRAAHAQASLSFSGGNNSPLIFTLNAPVAYTITAPVNNTDPLPYYLFVFKGAGNVVPGGTFGSSSITFDVNGGPALTTPLINSGFTAGELTPNDIYLYVNIGNTASPSIKVGDVVTLRAGSLTTATNVSAPAPSNGSFTSLIVNGVGTRISSNAVGASANAPEPGSIALMLAGGAGFCGVIAFRRRKNVA